MGGYFDRAYRMDQRSFWSLFHLLNPILERRRLMINKILKEARLKRHGRPRRTRKYKIKSNRRGCPNGRIPNSSRLSSALRFFAGGDPHDIAIVHGISHTEVYFSVWLVVDAVNHCPELAILFPTDHQEQLRLAKEFEQKSQPGIDCCVGGIDGILIWTTQPIKSDCKGTSIGPRKFYCGRKHKFGLNMQAVCDANRKFLDVSICHPGATSDYLAFTTSSLHDKLENVDNFLAPHLAIFGDNAYVNNKYMVTPYKNVAIGTDEDNYNFYVSQLRINIECAFGMLVHRWRILRRPLDANMGIKKITALTHCLCKLHNYCIDRRLEAFTSPLDVDAALGFVLGDVPLDDAQGGGRRLDDTAGTEDRRPGQLLDGGQHHSDVNRSVIRAQRRAAEDDLTIPAHRVMKIVKDSGMVRPPLSQS